MHQLTNFYHLTTVALPFLRIYFSQKNYKKGQGDAYRFWEELVLGIPAIDHLEDPLKNRIAHYLFVNSITMQGFATLAGTPISESEQEAGWYLAAATPIADYLVDKEQCTFQQIEDMINDKYHHPLSGILRELYFHSKKLSGHQFLFDTYFQKTLMAQEKSLDQTDQNITTEELKTITWNKGGYALLLYRAALRTPLLKKEEKAIWHLGGLMQLHNDIFDLYRDLQGGIGTLPTTADSIRELRLLFDSEIAQCFNLFNAVPSSSVRRKRFFILLSLILNTGHICLDQYQNLEDENNGVFSPGKCSRKELVCDMDDFYKIIRNLFDTLKKKYPIAGLESDIVI